MCADTQCISCHHPKNKNLPLVYQHMLLGWVGWVHTLHISRLQMGNPHFNEFFNHFNEFFNRENDEKLLDLVGVHFQRNHFTYQFALDFQRFFSQKGSFHSLGPWVSHLYRGMSRRTGLETGENLIMNVGGWGHSESLA